MKSINYISTLLIIIFINNNLYSQCSINLDAGASGCYWNGSASKTKIVIEVSWSNAPTGQNIIVTGPPGSSPATRTITPGTISVTYLNHAVPPVTYATANQIIVSPQLVTFEMDANGATGLTASASFSTTTSCNAISNTFSLPAACTPLDCSGTMSGGTVFFDFNADGIRTSDETETGVVGVTIKAIDVNGLVYTTTSQKYGRWSLNIPSNAYPIRVEFSNLPNYARQGTLNGTDGRTTTQFIQAPDCNIDLGVLENSEFASANPAIFLSQMPSGNPLDPTGNVKDMDALLKVDYNAQGARDPSKTLSLAKADEIGCTWGLAHNKYTNKLFVSAFIRRHSGLGPKGIGGIYVVDPNTGLADSWDVETDFGIDVGSISDNFTRGLNKSVSGSSVDPEGLAKTCKEGIGDMDISENGNQLYFVNMYDKKLYRIDLTTYNSNGTKPTSANITSWPITNPSCIGGNFRPMGLKWYKGFLYIGVICDGESSNNKSNLRAFLYKLNPGNGVWTTMFDFPLTYPKGFPNKDNRGITGWYPWTDIWSDFIELSPLAIAYPQPVFSDIEFDVDGSIILAFGDRNGFQTGYKNKSNPDDGKQYSGFVGGDILRAFNNGSGKFILENNAMAGPNMGYAPGNNQGPGFGEYYNDDWIGDKGNLNHAECVLGALALKPGEGKVIVTIIDPVDSINWAGGFRFYDNASGLRTQAFTVYETDVNDIGTFAKSGGLGDMELLMELPTFIEIGNRAWIDENKDGVQDPNEDPLSGLKVALYKSGTKIAETITNSNGEYYFSSISSTDPNLNWIGTGVDTSILPTTSYQVVFGESQYLASILTISGIDYQLTTANSTLGTGNDQNDSDASIIANFPRINFNSPIAGAVNHTYDVGFWPVPVCVPPTATVNPTNPTCTGSNAPNNGMLTIESFAAGQRYQYSLGSSFNSGSAIPATITTIPIGGIIVNNLTNATQQYTVRIYDATDNACFVDRTVSLTMVSCVNCNCPCTSLIGNSSFESNLDDWVSFSVTSGTQSQYAVCGSKAGYIYFDNSGGEGDLYQELQTAIPGNTYTLTVYAGTGDANQVDQVRLKFLAGDYSQELQFVADIDHEYTSTGGLIKYTLVGICPVWADKVEVKFATENTNSMTKLIFDQVCLCSSSTPCIIPTATVTPTNPSCTGSNAPNNGILTISGFTIGQRYQYSIGTTFNSGSAIPISITTIPTDGIIANNLLNMSQQYTIRIYDASDNSCFIDRTVSIFSIALPLCTCSKVDNTNCATPNGSATATATGVTYLWSNGATTSTINGLNAGTYTVTVTSTTTSCTNTCSVTVVNNTSNPTANCTAVSNTNCATPNGSASVITNASTPTYLWSNGGTTATINSLNAGTYTVTVTNTTTSCTNTCSAIVTNTTTPPSVSCGKVDNTNCATPNGSATATASGVTYLWSNGATTATINGLNTGTYTVTVTSTTNACTATCSATVLNNTTNPTASCTPTANTNCTSPNGQATVTTNASNPSFIWSNGQTTATITGLNAGTYFVTVTNTTNSCTNTCSAIVVSSSSPPSISCTPIQPTCATPNGGSVSTSVTGGISPFTYLWSNGVTASIISNVGDGTYTVTVTDNNNCTASCSAVLNAPVGCCEIINLNLLIGNCNNKGTLTNANDDEYTFTLNPTGNGIGTTYTVSGLPNSPQTGTYGSPTTFGPYLISTGVLSITVVDYIASTCTKTASVTPPPTCSVCNVAPPVLSVNDNICPSRTGTINLIQGCGIGTFIQYSINNGSTWSSVKPLYSTTPRAILARCVNITDTICKSPNTTIKTLPNKCPNNGNDCTLTASATIDLCNNNGTDNISTDDYFTIQVNATVLNGGTSNKYEVVVGADPITGTGGNILNSGGTNYGSPVVVGNNKIFKADASSSYQLVIRDINNVNCFQIIIIDPVASCSTAPPKSPCYPVPCVPIGLIKN